MSAISTGIAEVEPVLFRVDPTLDPFRPEVDYVFSVMGRWLGLTFLRLESGVAGLVDIDYGPRPLGGAIWIRESFFTQGCHIGPDGLTLGSGWPGLSKVVPKSQHLMGGGVVPLFCSDTLDSALRNPGETGCAWEIDFDLVGAVFFQLSRIEELAEIGRDHYGRFCAEQTLAYRGGFLERPEADHQVALLGRVLKACGRVGRAARPMRVHLTHDVDRLRAYHGFAALARETLGNVLRRRVAPSEAIARAVSQLNAGEPFRSARWLMDRAEERGTECSFFFMAGTHHPVDADYAYRWRGQMRKVAEEIRSRGHGLGFHPGFQTWKDAGAWLSQKAALEDILEAQVLEGRQHVLRFHPYTWEIWEQAGMERDYGLGFPLGISYRAGTTRSYPAYGLRVRRPFRLEVIPTAVMEFALFMDKYVDISRQEALRRVTAAVAEHQYYCGDLAVLFHPVTVMTLQDEYRETLARVFAPIPCCGNG